MTLLIWSLILIYILNCHDLKWLFIAWQRVHSHNYIKAYPTHLFKRNLPLKSRKFTRMKYMGLNHTLQRVKFKINIDIMRINTNKPA